jgi:nucleotide-binding universal stress UspA family protein
VRSRIVFAYDGSIHGDWVGRYAVRLARASGAPLEVFHVEDGALTPAAWEARVKPLRDVAAASGVTVSLRRLPRSHENVATVLDTALSDSDERIVVCGLRARQSHRGFLHGTVSEKLLRLTHRSVLAIRVVSPSLLGHARHILLSLSQNLQSASRGAPFLVLFAAELARLSLLTVMSPQLGRFSRPTADDLHVLRARGMDFLRRVEAQLRGPLAPFELPVESQVVVSADWPNAIIREAGRAGAELVLLGATERTLTGRFVLGNPLERVLRDTGCDVAIFRRGRAT